MYEQDVVARLLLCTKEEVIEGGRRGGIDLSMTFPLAGLSTKCDYPVPLHGTYDASYSVFFSPFLSFPFLSLSVFSLPPPPFFFFFSIRLLRFLSAPHPPPALRPSHARRTECRGTCGSSITAVR